MAVASKQANKDIRLYYSRAYQASQEIQGRGKLSRSEWNKWVDQTLKGITTLTVSKLKSHWSKNKNYYLSNDNIPDKWKKHYLYTWEHKSKKWLFVCTIEDNKVKVIGVCNYKVLTSNSNNEYVMLKESVISLVQYLNENLIPLHIYV